MKDTFEEGHKTIHYYLEHSQALPEKMRKRISELSIRSDVILMNILKLFIISDKLLNKVKEKMYFKKKVEYDKKDVESLKRMIKETESALQRLVKDTKKYIEDIKKTI